MILIIIQYNKRHWIEDIDIQIKKIQIIKSKIYFLCSHSELPTETVFSATEILGVTFL